MDLVLKTPALMWLTPKGLKTIDSTLAHLERIDLRLLAG
jgi:hypothetical protein